MSKLLALLFAAMLFLASGTGLALLVVVWLGYALARTARDPARRARSSRRVRELRALGKVLGRVIRADCQAAWRAVARRVARKAGRPLAWWDALEQQLKDDS